MERSRQVIKQFKKLKEEKKYIPAVSNLLFNLDKERFTKEVLECTLPKEKILPVIGKRAILCTASLPFVNATPHLGTLLQLLSADIITRYHRLRGHNVLYICGADEFGAASLLMSEKLGVTPKELCDKYYEIHKQCYNWFNIQYDYFGRTTSPTHTEMTTRIYKQLIKNGFIFEKEIDQLYCDLCNRFLADRFVVGTCPFCKDEGAKGDQCDKCSKVYEQVLLPKCVTCVSRPSCIYRKTLHKFLDLPKFAKRYRGMV